MSRYSLNLRSIYDRDEETGSQKLARGISGAIDEYRKYQDDKNAEENAMAQRGATRDPNAPTPSLMDRVRGIRGKIDEMLHGSRGGDAGPQLQPTGTFAPTQQGGVTPTGAGPGIVPATRRNAMPMPIGPAAGVPDTGAALAVNAADRYFNTAPAASVARGVANDGASVPIPASPQPGIAAPTTAGPNAGRPSIASAINNDIAPVHLKGRFGNYTADPLYADRVKLAGKNLDDEQRIQSLIAYGMSPERARAEVLNNTVGYDPDLGRHYGSSNAPTQTQWLERQRILQENRIALEDARRNNRISETDYQKELMEWRRDRDEVTSHQKDIDNELKIAEQNRRNAPPTTIATGTSGESPEDKAARDKAARGAQKHTANAETLRRNGAATPAAQEARAAEIARDNPNMSEADIRAQMRAEGFRLPTRRR